MSFFSGLVFPQEDACHLCGGFQDGTGIVCAQCVRELEALRLPVHVSRALPVLRGNMAAFPHRESARRMVHQLKYRSDPAAASFMALYMVSALDGVRADLAVPVPLHAAREKQRGFNQAALLAREVCSHTGMICLEEGLKRVRPTDSQVRRTRAERLSAMADAFEAAAGEQVRGKSILLVDDVVTTGATAIACAETLLGAGAKEVWLLTFCRA